MYAAQGWEPSVFFSHEKVSKVKITSWSINYFAISSDGKECWANVCKDEQRYQKQKQKKEHVALDIRFTLGAN